MNSLFYVFLKYLCNLIEVYVNNANANANLNLHPSQYRRPQTRRRRGGRHIDEPFGGLIIYVGVVVVVVVVAVDGGPGPVPKKSVMRCCW